jgi:hypothetical protein
VVHPPRLGLRASHLRMKAVVHGAHKPPYAEVLAEGDRRSTHTVDVA